MTSTPPAEGDRAATVQHLQTSIQELLTKNAMTLAEVFPELIAPRRGPKPGTKVAPKYRHPTDAGVVWSGRGKTPVWLRTLEEAGRQRSEFLIAPND